MKRPRERAARPGDSHARCCPGLPDIPSPPHSPLLSPVLRAGKGQLSEETEPLCPHRAPAKEKGWGRPISLLSGQV